jgi:hypothetical protein
MSIIQPIPSAIPYSLRYDHFEGARSVVLKIASLINADQTGVFFGQHAILVFSVVLAGMFAAGIGLWYLLDQPGSRVWHFAPEDRQRFQDSAISYAFRDRFFRPFARVAYRPSPKGHLCLYYTISLFVLAVTGASFLLLGLKIRQQDWLVRFDHSFSASLHEHLLSSAKGAKKYRINVYCLD